MMHNTAFCRRSISVGFFAKGDVYDYFLLNDFIKETDDKIFTYFTAKNLFPAVVWEWINKFVHNQLF